MCLTLLLFTTSTAGEPYTKPNPPRSQGGLGGMTAYNLVQSASPIVMLNAVKHLV